jgi:hypothetical protein
MKLLTLEAKLVCRHINGVIQFSSHLQNLVRISGQPVLVEFDPLGKLISGCPNIGMTIKPCNQTVNVDRGYSEFIRIQNLKVCLDSLTGLTDGTPPGSVRYDVQHPGQSFVSAER